MVLLGIGNNPMVGCTVACAVELTRDTPNGVSLFLHPSSAIYSSVTKFGFFCKNKPMS